MTIKAIVNTDLNERTERPSVNSPNYSYYKKGDKVTVVNKMKGDPYEGNNLWYELENGSYVWSGGIELIEVKDEPVITNDLGKEIPYNIQHLGWGATKLQYHKLWRFCDGSGIRIAILDSGTNDHMAIRDSIKFKCNIIDDSEDISDDIGHGTHIAGILCGKGDKLQGISPEAQLLVIKLVDNKTYLNNKLLEKAIALAIKQKANIISMSLEHYQSSKEIQDLINLNQDSCVFIAAAGNKGRLNRIKDSYPASYENCISVGAIDENFKRYERSNISNYLDVVAPGVNIDSCIDQSNYSKKSDTSFAVPFVTGLAALLLSYQLKSSGIVNPNQVTAAILNSTSNIGSKVEYGRGLINPYRSLGYLISL